MKHKRTYTILFGRFSFQILKNSKNTWVAHSRSAGAPNYIVENIVTGTTKKDCISKLAAFKNQCEVGFYHLIN